MTFDLLTSKLVRYLVKHNMGNRHADFGLYMERFLFVLGASTGQTEENTDDGVLSEMRPLGGRVS